MTALDTLIFYAVPFAAGPFVLWFLIDTILQAGKQLGPAGTVTARRLALGVAGWALFAVIYALIARDHIIWLLPTFLIPIAGGMALTFTPAIRDLLAAVSISRLIGVQLYRTAGAVFLYAYFVTELPGSPDYSREFALGAGWGDVLTGVLAIPTALAVHYRVPFNRLIAVAWCFIGIGDLIVAPYLALTYGGLAPSDFPLNTILFFWGPPLGILLHLVVLRALWIQRPAITLAASEQAA